MIYSIIEKKRNSLELTKNEIDFFVSSFVKEEVSRAQMSSFLMAIVLNGMSYNETYYLSHAIKDSGKTISFNELVVDKHSTGGVSDSTTLIITPLLASLGIDVAKMSGRSLGFTGGTIDKLEVFSGYKTEKTIAEFKKIVKSVGCSIISQSDELAIADKQIYELRNETATVDSIPLIASSVMGKKLAGGAKFLLLNVHFGSGAFMKTQNDATKLANTMVKIGKNSDIETIAVVSDMNTPLSSGVGCAREVISALNILNNTDTTSFLYELSLEIVSIMISKLKNTSKKDALKIAKNTLTSESALNKFKEMLQAHGVKQDVTENLYDIEKTSNSYRLMAKQNGYIKEIDASIVARVAKRIAELERDENKKKFVGIELQVSLRDKVRKGDILAVVYANNNRRRHEILSDLEVAFDFSRRKPKPVKLIKKVIY